MRIKLKLGPKRKSKDSQKKKALRASWDDLKVRYAPNPNVVVPKKINLSLSYDYRGKDQLVKRPAIVPVDPLAEKRIRYEGQMAEREQRAQEEIERKRTQVAILYNKGPYMMITDSSDPKTFGRK